MDPLLDTNCDLLSSTPDISSSSLSFIQRNYLECLLFPVWSRTWSSLKVWTSSKFKLARLSSILFVATCSDGWLNHGLFPRGYLIQHPHYRRSGPSSRSHSYTLSYSFSQTCHLVLCSQHVHRKLLDEQKTRPTLRMEQLLAAQIRSKIEQTVESSCKKKSGHFPESLLGSLFFEENWGLPLSCFAKIWSPRFQAEQNLSHGPFSS